MMTPRPIECRGCPLDPIATGFLRPEGQGTLGVLIIGEAAGEAEAAASLPFRPYAAAGSVLERAIKRCGYTRDQFVLWNTVACRPPGNKLEGTRYERGAVEHCKTHFKKVIETFAPKCILALGGTALRATTRYAGKDCGVSDLRGFVLPSPTWQIPVVPSFHPSFIRRGQAHLLGVLMRDLRLAVQVAEGGENGETPQRYEEAPTLAQAWQYVDFLASRPDLAISYDIETDYSKKDTDESEAVRGTGDNITQIQFSHEPGQAIVFQWKGEYPEVAAAILGLPNTKVGHNVWGFDNEKLRQHGVEVKGTVDDTMWLWHHLQPDLPKKLQFVTSFYDPYMKPWKHLAQSEGDFTFYGGADVDSVQRIYPKLVEQLQAEGLYDSYVRYVRGLWPSLQRMTERGIPIDLDKRAALREELRKEQDVTTTYINEHVVERFPSLIKTHPENGYVREPEDVSGLERRTFRVTLPISEPCVTCSGTGEVAAKRLGKTKQCPKCKRRGTIASKTRFESVQLERYCRVLGFNPDSPIQLFDYMRLARHPVPTDRTGKRTTDGDELERLGKRTGDALYPLVLRFREVGKVLETYIDGAGWEPSSAGRIHSNFAFGPATWQLNSKNPNIQNIPKHGSVAKQVRSYISARPGHTLVEFDFAGFHALTLGLEAQDKTYMDLARLDPHSYLAARLLNLTGSEYWLEKPWQELAELLARVKHDHEDVRDQKAKPAMHGYGFGMGGARLYHTYPDAFNNKNEAQYVIDTLDRAFPKIGEYRARVRAEAHKKGALFTRYGAIRRFYDVYTWDGSRGDYRPGEQFNEAVAFQPANDAFGKVRDCMLELEEDGTNDRYNFILNGHDSLLFEPLTRDLDGCVERVSACMESPARLLSDDILCPGGLRTGIEATAGGDWAHLETIYRTDLSKLMIA